MRKSHIFWTKIRLNWFFFFLKLSLLENFIRKLLSDYKLRIIFHGILALGDLGWRVEPSIQGSDLCDGEGSRAWSSNESAPARTNTVHSFSEKHAPPGLIILSNFPLCFTHLHGLLLCTHTHFIDSTKYAKRSIIWITHFRF